MKLVGAIISVTVMVAPVVKAGWYNKRGCIWCEENEYYDDDYTCEEANDLIPCFTTDYDNWDYWTDNCSLWGTKTLSCDDSDPNSACEDFSNKYDYFESVDTYFIYCTYNGAYQYAGLCYWSSHSHCWKYSHARCKAGKEAIITIVDESGRRRRDLKGPPDHAVAKGRPKVLVEELGTELVEDDEGNQLMLLKLA